MKATNESLRAELRHRLIALFPDDRVASRPCRAMTVSTARGTTAAAHILCNNLKPGQTLHVKVMSGGRAVPAAEWFRLVDVPVEKNTDTIFGLEKEGRINPYVIRRAPFRIYDAMAPMRSVVPVDASTMAFRLHLPVPAGAKPGRRRYEIEVSSGGRTQSLHLDVEAYAAVVPPAGPGSFPYTNWFDYRTIADRHGLTLWSPAYWSMLRQYARLMAHGRQNSFWLPLDIIFDGLVLNTSRLRRLVRLFTDEGMHWIEGGHVAAAISEGDYLTQLVSRPAMSVEGHAVLASVLRQLYAAILANGWQGRWLQHVKDEPGKATAPAYRILTGMVHKYMPNVPVIDAIMDPALVGTANIWVIQNDEVRDHLPHFQAQREFGDRVWLYSCMGPGGNGLNRLLDMELMRCTLLGWVCLASRFDGYLHWGLNHYYKDQDPFKQSCHGDLPAGDTHIVYPGTKGPWSSVRLEAHREGLEDVELLRQLQRQDPKAHDRLVRSVVRDCWDYTKDVRVLEAARRRVCLTLR